MESRPSLSVIVQIGAQRKRSVNCLESLFAQDVIDELEILVDDFAPDDALPVEVRGHPSIIYNPRHEYQAIGELKAEAVGSARAPIVAFIEDHCVAQEGWARAIIESHQNGWHAIGGRVINGNPGVGISDLIEVMNYHRWLPPVEAGEQELLVGHNTAYDREALLSYGEALPALIGCDPVLQWQMAKDGYRLYLNPAVRFKHINETEIGSILRGYFLWNRFFAPTRARQFGWSRFRKLAWSLASPLMPFIRVAKISAYLTREKRAYRKAFFRSLPVQLLAHSAAGLGQMIGLLFGAGDAEVEFLRYELNQVRRTKKDR
jgi:hypothetical protein